MDNVRLSNNQSHELKLFQTLLDRMHELESKKGLDRVEGVFVIHGVSLKVENLSSEQNQTFSILLDPTKSPLRVDFEGGIYHGLKVRTYKETARFLKHVIVEVEKQICWASVDEEKMGVRNIDEEIREEEEDEGEPEIYHEVNLGDTPGGFKIYE